MYILGYSGINNIVSYRARALGLSDPIEKRIVQGMDAAACLIHNGHIIAAQEEERFTNDKHTPQFPIHAIQACLAEAKISIQEIDYICHGFHFDAFKNLYQGDAYNSALYENILSKSAQEKNILQYFPELEGHLSFHPVEHHLAHAASAFYPSGFKDALVLVADAMGEAYSISVYHGSNQGLKVLAQYDLFSSIGMLYSLVTWHLGFLPNDGEYKTMGLSAYGNKKTYESIFEELILLEPGGEIIIPELLSTSHSEDNYTFQSIRQHLTEKLGPKRLPEEEILQDHKNIAAALQYRTEQAMLHLATYWQKMTGLKCCCMAGGVALNCVVNRVLSEANLFDKIYVQAAASDAGTALGAALVTAALHENMPIKREPSLPLYGYVNREDDITMVLAEYSSLIQDQKLQWDELCQRVAKMIRDNKIVAWMQGKMEYGPRALGHRSILANPCDPNMQDRVNAIIKKRESFRPFAPSVKEELANTYFSLNSVAHYDTMLFTCDVRPEYQQKFPAIIHDDQTARIQAVNKKQHPLYWQLLDCIEQEIGFGIVLNTSFNVNKQAIVCDARQAIETFLQTELDALIIHNYFLTKK